MIADIQTFERMKEDARRDDWHTRFVGSDIRQMLGEIERLRAFVQSLDGKTIAIRGEGDTFVDDGIIVASDILQQTGNTK